MALSDELLKLSNQSRELEASIEATKERNDEKLKARKAQLDAQLTDARTKLGAKVNAAGDETAAEWADAQKSVSDAFASLRADSTARHAKWSAKRAGRAADDAEADALDSIDFAIYAIQEAEYAVLDAAIARDEADEKAADAAVKEVAANE
ncbi:hypothetical protein ACPPVQ_13365 [Diaminobutyricibacter sp. McL0618]|uniref:hypothetical protein n=1 Tax=Leifsonia sp. McL0618 TaxID=3415677 RepID=UPI003CF0937F